MTESPPTINGNLFPGARAVPAEGETVNSNLDFTYTNLAPLSDPAIEALESGLNPNQFVYAEEAPPPPEEDARATSSKTQKRSKKTTKK